MSAAHLLVDTVTYEAYAGRSGANPTFSGTQVAVTCRVEYGSRTIVGGDGTRKEVDAVILSEVQIPRESRLWLPDADTADDTTAKPVIHTKQASTPGGYALYETYL